jgi:endo-alpha-1,4-polygalactosaminidase (GH114 family)
MVCSLALAPPTQAAPRDRVLRHVHTWAFAIGDGTLNGDLVARYSRYDLVVLDGEGATARQVAALRRAGKLVLAYVDVGTIEPWRSWYTLLKPYRLAYWPDWGEWYAEVSKPGFRHAVAARIAPAVLGKRFDGLFLDNTDMIESYPRQAAGMRTLIAALAGLVHRHHRLLFTQNGEDSIGSELRYFDGWNREDATGTYDFGLHRYVVQPRDEIIAAQRALRRIAAAGLLVLSTDYVSSAGSPTGTQAVANACAAGALPFLSNIDLTRVPAVPAHC